MAHALFDLPADLRSAVRDAAGEGHPPWPFINRARFIEGAEIRTSDGAVAGSFFGPAAGTLDAIPRDSRYLAISGRAPDFQNLTQFGALEVVQVYDRVTDAQLRVLGQARSLRMVSLFGVQATDLNPLAELAQLEHLHCDDAPTLTRLQSLTQLRHLRTLWLEHFRGLRELSQIGLLTQLGGLVLAGSMWTAMRVRSLRPLSALVQLERLHLVNVRVEDGSLAPVTGLTHLRELRVPNWFGIEEFAALAALMPKVDGTFHSPWFVEPKPLDRPGYSVCKRSGRYALGMTLGKPAKRLCPDCDAAKVAKHIGLWNTLVAAARQHHPTSGARTTRG